MAVAAGLANLPPAVPFDALDDRANLHAIEATQRLGRYSRGYVLAPCELSDPSRRLRSSVKRLRHGRLIFVFAREQSQRQVIAAFPAR